MNNGKKITAGRVAAVVGLLVLAVVGLGFGTFLRILHKGIGEHTGGSGGSVSDAWQIAIQPKEGFPGKDKIVILGMGIDDNWTNKDEVYTAGSRTDTLFLMTLDLNTRKATMLSIPRDTYTHIAGTKDRYFKINEAYETGGPQRAIDTVDELLGVHADHYLVLNVDATQKLVDALGGVDVDVQHEMHYHDKWGHLSIDLMPGFQHLNGQQAVGYARYRHPDAGKKPTLEDGDIQRMARQHILMRAMIVRAKSFTNVAQAPHLVDVGMSTIRTDLTRTQLFDIAAIFRGVKPEDIQTASLPGDDFRGTNGAWFYRLDMKQAKAYTDWLVRGDRSAARRLVPVVVINGTMLPGLAQRVVRQLKIFGYADIRNGGNAVRSKVRLAAADTTPGAVPAGSGFSARTVLLDTGVPNPQAAKDVAALMGLADPVEIRKPVKPNKVGWTPPTTLTVTLGQDYAQAVKDSGTLDTAEAVSTAPSGQN